MGRLGMTARPNLHHELPCLPSLKPLRLERRQGIPHRTIPADGDHHTGRSGSDSTGAGSNGAWIGTRNDEEPGLRKQDAFAARAASQPPRAECDRLFGDHILAFLPGTMSGRPRSSPLLPTGAGTAGSSRITTRTVRPFEPWSRALERYGGSSPPIHDPSSCHCVVRRGAHLGYRQPISDR